MDWDTAVVAGTFELLAVLIVSAVLTPDVEEALKCIYIDVIVTFLVHASLCTCSVLPCSSHVLGIFHVSRLMVAG